MTLEAEIPISIEHKVHRVYHQHHHHHHYHLHHILDHHHLHIHNRSVFRRAPISSQPQQQANQIATPPRAPAILNHSHQQDDDNHNSNSTSRQFQQLQYDDHDDNHQELVHSRGLRPQDEQALASLNTTTTTTTFDTCPGVVAAKSSVDHHQLQQQHRNYSKQRSQIQFLLISAFAYILSPIDLIPEAIFGIFGIVDDIVFLLMCLFCVAIILLYPLFREVRRTIFDKLSLERKQQRPAIVLDDNKCDENKSK